MDCGHCCRLDLIIEAGCEADGAKHAEFVFGKTTLRVADGADDSGIEIGAAADEIEDLVGGGVEHHAVDSEVAALDVLARIFGEAYFVGTAAIGVAYVEAEGGDFDCVAMMSWSLTGAFRSARNLLSFFLFSIRHQHDSKLLAHGVGLRKDLHDLLRSRVRGHIIVSRLAIQKKIADASSGQISLVAPHTQGADDFFGELFGVRQKALSIQHSAFSRRNAEHSRSIRNRLN